MMAQALPRHKHLRKRTTGEAVVSSICAAIIVALETSLAQGFVPLARLVEGPNGRPSPRQCSSFITVHRKQLHRLLRQNCCDLRSFRRRTSERGYRWRANRFSAKQTVLRNLGSFCQKLKFGCIFIVHHFRVLQRRWATWPSTSRAGGGMWLIAMKASMARLRRDSARRS